MEWFTVTFNLYKHAVSRAIALVTKNLAVMGSVFVYGIVMWVAYLFAVRLGFAGGFLITVVWAACVSSFLYLVEMMVRTSRVSLEDFRRSFLVYLGDVVGVMFIFWIFWTFATPALLALPNGPLIIVAISIAIFVFFNAVPELIYLGHHSSLALLAESYAFISANWVEWFPATLAASGVIYVVMGLPLSGLAGLVQDAVVGLLVYFAMVMRGLLFMELAGSSRRSRAFRYRAGGN